MMTSPFSRFGIVGTGAWGTALALALHRAGRVVVLLARSSDGAARLGQSRENTAYLPGIIIPSGIKITADWGDITACQAVILASPAQHLRTVCAAVKAHLGSGRQPLIIAAKGIEQGSHKLLSEVVAEIVPAHPLFVLSGPSFAAEVAQGLPAALTLASESDAETLARAMTSPVLRLYTTNDIIGAQIGGAVKNVLAIACGIVAGRALGENARAALMTRGLAEIMRLGAVLGARSETLMGLSGLGDVALTCSSPQSRNMSLGIALGQGQKLDEILAARTGVTEGIATAAATLSLAYRHGVDMPVTAAVAAILRGDAAIDGMIADLLSRPLRHEAA